MGEFLIEIAHFLEKDEEGEEVKLGLITKKEGLPEEVHSSGIQALKRITGNPYSTYVEAYQRRRT